MMKVRRTRTKSKKRADSSFMMKQAYFFNSYTMLFLLATLIIFYSFFIEPILEDLDIPHRYRPENLQLLCDATG